MSGGHAERGACDAFVAADSAVAAYGQKLRNDPYLEPAFGWDEVVSLAQSARGPDPTGIRAQFVSLARSAKDVQGKTTLGAR